MPRKLLEVAATVRDDRASGEGAVLAPEARPSRGPEQRRGHRVSPRLAEAGAGGRVVGVRVDLAEVPGE